MDDLVTYRSSVTIHRVALLEVHDYPAFNHSFSLSTGHEETIKVPNTAGRAGIISMSSWGLVRGWCCAWVLPVWLTPVGSVPVPGFTSSDAAAAHSHCWAHPWSADHKMPIVTGAGSNISFSEMRALATVLNFHVEYFPCVCFHVEYFPCILLLAVSA